MFETFIETFLVSSFFLFLLNFIGEIFFFFKKNEDSHIGLFKSLVLGLITLTTLFSICKTFGNTISIGFILIALLFCFQNGIDGILKNTNFKFKLNKKALALLFFLCSLFSLLFSYLYHDDNINNIVHFDDVFYTLMGESLSNYGVENTHVFGNFFYQRHAQPYHYVEIWISSIIHKIFNQPLNLVVSVTIRTILCSIYSFGLISITRLFTKNNYIQLLAFGCTTVCPFLLDYSFVTQAAVNIHQPKFAIGSCFFILFFILIIQKSEYWFYPILSLPIVNIAFAPVTVTYLIFISFTILVFDKSEK